jgi:hypothetical protein
MDCGFEKLAFINVFGSQCVLIYLLRFIRGKLLKVFKMWKLLQVFGLLFKQCTIFWEEMNIIFGKISLYSFIYI